MEKVLLNEEDNINKEDFDSICRSCLLQGPIANIFDLRYCETSFAEILFELFSTEVNTEDGMPTNVCETCICEIIRFYNFRTVFLAAENILQSIVTKELNKKIHRPKLYSEHSEDIKLEDFSNTMIILNEIDDNETYNPNNYQELRTDDQIINLDASDDDIQNDYIATNNIDRVYNSPIDHVNDSSYEPVNDSPIGVVDHSFIEPFNDFPIEPVNDSPYAPINDSPIEVVNHSSIEPVNDSHIDPTNHSLIWPLSHFFLAPTNHCLIESINHSVTEPVNDSHTETVNNFFTDPVNDSLTEPVNDSLIEPVKDCFIDTEVSKNLHENHILETVNSDAQIQGCGNGFKKKQSAPKERKQKIITCICQRTFTLRSEYIRHKKEQVHPPARHHTCTICNKNFKKSHLKGHMRSHTKEKPYECKLCPSRFSFNINLIRHMRGHTGEKPYMCEFCGKCFSQKTSLLQHRKIHTGEKRYLCAHCGERFRYSVTYVKHLNKKHNIDEGNKKENSVLKTRPLGHGEKKFLCNCGKSFSSSSGLRSHAAIMHSETKPYSCAICYRMFSRKIWLGQHMLTHTDSKPYTCKICRKAFRHRSNLSSHLKLHSAEKPYTCPACNMSFRQYSNLKRHINCDHTGETPYLCDLCMMGFYESTALEEHKKLHLKEWQESEMEEEAS